MTLADPPARAEVNLVEVRKVRHVYGKGGGANLLVLEDVDLTLKPNEIVGLLGRSGSGKSTLLRAISGLIRPTAGTVVVRDAPGDDTAHGVAMVFQSFALFPWLTVLQNVELGLEAQGIEPAERARRAVEAIDLIGLDGFESAFPKELSGGMRQRVGFARALVVQPDLLLMDEPFSALDVLTAENLRTELLELWQANEFPADAILIVTHNIEEAVTFSDRVIVLGTNPGRIKAELTCLLPRPRDRRSEEFGRLVDEIYGIMTDRPIAAPETPEAEDAGVQQVMLPHATVDGMAGLTELVAAAGEDSDLGDLAGVVGFEIDDLFPIIDALTILRFAYVQEGHIKLTETGQQFAAADIQHSKEIFRAAALEHVPLVRRIHRALQHSSDGNLRDGFFLDLLHNYYSAEESRAQLDTAIDWARYAELFEYDAGRGELMLPAGLDTL
jgi:NitT/TauT family transport system ATP-binding protein